MLHGKSLFKNIAFYDLSPICDKKKRDDINIGATTFYTLLKMVKYVEDMYITGHASIN
jgi:hypothetical protein